MREIRRFVLIPFLAALSLLAVWGGRADAFWGFGDPREAERSGLDLAQGYDRNTVVNISGPVAVPPRTIAGGMIAVDLRLPDEQIVVVLGPAWYLQDDDLDWKVGDQVTVRGSLARGKDGRAYLLSQQVTLPGGTTIELRGQSGAPSWSAGGGGGAQTGGAGGQMQRGSGGVRRGR
jgi:hypothetical protein